MSIPATGWGISAKETIHINGNISQMISWCNKYFYERALLF